MSDEPPIPAADPALIDAARERQQYAAALVEAASSDAGARREDGLVMARIVSDAVRGFTPCVRHGQHNLRVNGKTGRPDPLGICEHCWREDFKTDQLERRDRETRAQQIREAELVLERLRALEERDTEPEVVVGESWERQPDPARGPVGDPVGASAVPRVRGTDPVPAGDGAHATAVGGVPPAAEPAAGQRGGTGPHPAPDWEWLAGVRDDGA